MTTRNDTAAKTKRLTTLETTIRAHSQSLWDTGNALREIRDKSLWLVRRGEITYSAYCEQTFDLSAKRVAQFIDAAVIKEIIPTITNEAQARPLAAYRRSMLKTHTSETIRQLLKEVYMRATVNSKTDDDVPTAQWITSAVEAEMAEDKRARAHARKTSAARRRASSPTPESKATSPELFQFSAHLAGWWETKASALPGPGTSEHLALLEALKSMKETVRRMEQALEPPGEAEEPKAKPARRTTRPKLTVVDTKREAQELVSAFSGGALAG